MIYKICSGHYVLFIMISIFLLMVLVLLPNSFEHFASSFAGQFLGVSNFSILIVILISQLAGFLPELWTVYETLDVNLS